MLTSLIWFWASSGLLVYTYFGYPLLIWIWAQWGKRHVVRKSYLTSVSIVVVAHNEEERIDARIKNLLALDYPDNLLEIVIASDGSSDRTVARALCYQQQGVRVVEYRENRGKPAVLNELVPQLESEIIVFLDTRQRITSDALRALLANFEDPETGVVSGELILEDKADTEVGEGVGFYWRYEKFIRSCESRVDSTVGVTGAIYAIRRRLYELIPEETILDDVLIPMRIARQGYRVVFESKARAHDKVFKRAEAEFTRKVRTIAGNFQLFTLEPWLLNPVINRLWFQTYSHKLCRLFSPFCLVAALSSNFLLLDAILYRVILVLQLLFYSAAMAGYMIQSSNRKGPFVNVAYAFCLLNWATIVGFMRFILRRQRVTWQKAR